MASPSADPAGTITGSIGSNLWAAMVPWTRSHSARALARRIQSRTVSDSRLVDVEQVVRPAMTLGHDDLTDRHARPRKEVEAFAVLHHPASLGELTINQDPGALFSGETLLIRHPRIPSLATMSDYRRPPGARI